MPEPPPETLSWLRHAASCGKADAQLTLLILERLDALEQRPIPGTVELATPTPEAAPVATDEVQPLPPHIAITYQPKSVYLPLRTAQPPAPQPAPPAAPAGGLVERVAGSIWKTCDMGVEARAAICEVAAWLDQRGQHACSLLLREELDR
jgi:hypothetical protein